MELSFRGTFAPGERKVQELSFHGTFAPVELSLLRSECSKNFRHGTFAPLEPSLHKQLSCPLTFAPVAYLTPLHQHCKVTALPTDQLLKIIYGWWLMRVGYCKVYRSCFRTSGAKVLEIFVLMIRQFHRNESSWNVRSRGMKVPRERMFHGMKVLGTFAPEEWKFHRSESSKERMFHGMKVPRERKFSMVLSLPGTKVQRNEKAWNL